MAGLGRIASAILGLLAIQHPEGLGVKDSEEAGASPGEPDPGAPGLLERLVDGVWSGDGLDDLLDAFRRSGSRDEAESWIGVDSNRPLTVEQVRAAIDPDTLGELADQTGLPPNELLLRIATDVPDAVDKVTPEGHLPTPPQTAVEEGQRSST